MKLNLHEYMQVFDKKLLEMAALSEASIYKAIESLKKLDASMARAVIESDAVLDALENEIEEMGIDILALKQPVAIDLRFITTGMKLNAELERIGDLSVNIAQRVLEIADQPLLKPLNDIPRLSEIARRMVKEAITAYINRDEKLARHVILNDTESDLLRNRVQEKLVNEYMYKDGTTAPRAVALLLIARHLERICDHATYIAEDVIYMIRAKMVKHHPEELNNE
jgi:phosphate transport system protein